MAGVRKRRAPPPRPAFSPVEATHPDTRRIRETLATIPQQPKPIYRAENWVLAVRSVADYVTTAPGWLARLRGRFVGYPRPFRKFVFKSWDGTLLSGWLGVHAEGGRETRRGTRGAPVPREGLLMVPGMFTSKDNAVQKARALKIFRDWGYHVLSLDLRGFGESARIYNTAGWKEAEDIQAAVEYFRAHVPLQKLHIYSESLGANAAIIAAARTAERGFRLVDGGILAVGPYADIKQEAAHLSARPDLRDQFFMVQWFFIQLLRLGGATYSSFVEYLEDAAAHYGLPLKELYEKSSSKNFIRKVNVPLLVLNSKDDPVVPVSHARTFQRLLRGRDNPTSWLLDWGNHCAHELADPDWFWALLHEFFDFYCLLPPRPSR